MNYDIYTHSNLASYTERALILTVTVNLRVFSQLVYTVNLRKRLGCSNSGFFRLPNVYVYAHKWLERQLLGSHFRFRISPCVINAAVSKFLSKMDVFGTFFFGIKVR